MIRCDICHRRGAVITVQMFHGHGSDYGKPSSKVRWCEPCALAVMDRYSGPYIWPRLGVFLEPHEVPA